MISLAESISNKRKSNSFSKWILLIGGLILMYLFVTVAMPFLSHVLGFNEMHQQIIDEDIHAGEWFYVFVEQIYEIVPRMYNTMKYPPGMKKKTLPGAWESFFKEQSVLKGVKHENARRSAIRCKLSKYSRL